MRQGSELPLLPRKEPSVQRIRNDPVRTCAGVPKLLFENKLFLPGQKLLREARHRADDPDFFILSG